MLLFSLAGKVSVQKVLETPVGEYSQVSCGANGYSLLTR